MIGFRLAVWAAGLFGLIVFYLVLKNLVDEGELFLGLIAGAIAGVLAFMMAFGLLDFLTIGSFSTLQNVNKHTQSNQNESPCGFFEMPEFHDKKIPPSHFGYWLVRWSDEAVQEKITEMAKELHEIDNGTQKPYLASYFVRLQLLALYSASYYAFSSTYFTLSNSCYKEIDKGMLDSIKEYKGADGAKIPDDYVIHFMGWVKKFREELSMYILFEKSEDFGVTTIQNTLSSESKYADRFSVVFIESMQEALSLSDRTLDESDKSFIKRHISEIPDSVIISLKIAHLKYISRY